MDKSLMIFIAIGIGFLYFITNFVGDIQKEDDAYSNNDYKQAHMYDKYKTVDSIGQDVLDVVGAPAATQLAAWNSSMLKDDFLMLFPDFSAMKVFVEERVKGEPLKNKLTQMIEGIEDSFFSGAITSEDAKKKLSTLQ